MSKFLFVAFLLVSPLFGMAQLDTLDLKRLEPTYYYWDTCWVGHYVPDSTYEVIDWDCNHKIVTYRRSCSMGMTGFSKREQQLESARYFHSDSTLRIFGVAAAIEFKKMTEPVFDSDFTHCLPEYFILYRTDSVSNMIPVDSVRSDIATSSRYTMMLKFEPVYHVWCTPEDPDLHVDIVDTIINYFPITEAFFEEPIEMQGDFYIGATNNNNFFVCIGIDSIEFPPNSGMYHYNHEWGRALPFTGLKGIIFHDGQGGTDPNYIYRIPVRPFRQRAHSLEQLQWFNDTLWHNMGAGTGAIGMDPAIFPIFDTCSYVPPVVTDDTCPMPSTLRVLYIIGDTVTLVWNGPEEVFYEVAVCRRDSPEVLDTTCLVSTQFVTMSGLSRGSWYKACVRTLCDSSRNSDWCDSALFFIPNKPYVDISDSIPVASFTVNMGEQHTIMMPNPATSVVSLFSSYYITDITLFTIDGRKVLNKKVGAAGANLDVASLPRGTYIVRINTSRGPVFKRLILR